jgi:hypothetical protein
MTDMAGPAAASWSEAVGEADWIRDRLIPFQQNLAPPAETGGSASYRAGFVIPAGFEAYARVLHPLPATWTPAGGRTAMRWREVAAWSSRPIGRETQFHSVALPQEPTAAQPLFSRPSVGSPHPPDAMVLSEVLRGATATPEQCFFCLWDGYSWERRSILLTRRGEPPIRRPGPLPEEVLRGPRVHHPIRNYLLYTGAVEAVIAPELIGDRNLHAANLWWPADRAWCVASDIDLSWTYVGGTRAVIDRLLVDERIEAVPAAIDDPIDRVEEWVQRWVDEGTAALLATGEATIATPMGSIRFSLERPGPSRPGRLRKDNGSWASVGQPADEAALRLTVSRSLTRAVIRWVGE